MSNDVDFIKAIHNLHQTTKEITQDELADKRTMTQAILLHHIGTNEGCSQTDLTGRTDVDRSTLADTILRMVKGGLVARRRTKEDARRYALRLTPAGQEEFGKLKKQIAKARSRIEEVYPRLTMAAVTPVKEAAE